MDVRFYATLRPLVGGKNVHLDLAEDATVKDLLDTVTERFPELGAKIWTPEGTLGEVSNGGTASDSGGRARPMTSLPTSAIASAPPSASATRTSGVQSRQRHASTMASPKKMIGCQIGPPELFASHPPSSSGSSACTGWPSTSGRCPRPERVPGGRVATSLVSVVGWSADTSVQASDTEGNHP